MAAPNLVRLKWDDYGIETMPAYDAVNQQLGLNTNGLNPWPYPSTPNFNAELAARGVLLGELYMKPTCSQTRAVIQTGREAFEIGLGGVVVRENISLSQYRQLAALDRGDELFLPQALKLHATQTIQTEGQGKSHLGMHSSQGGDGLFFFTRRLGFDRFVGTVANLGDADVDFVAKALKEGVDPLSAGGLAAGYWYFRVGDTGSAAPRLVEIEDEYSTLWIRDQVLDFLRNRATPPFYLEVNFHAPHSPYGSAFDRLSGCNPGRSDAEMDANTHQGSAVYPIADIVTPATATARWRSSLAAMETLDLVLGEIITELQTQGFYNDTVLMVTGDNGMPAGLMRDAITHGEDVQDPMATLATSGKMKGAVYRMSGRAPGFISGPPAIVGGTIGRTTNVLVDAADINATIEDLMEVSSEAAAVRAARGKTYRGASLRSVLADEVNEPTWTRRHVLLENYLPNGHIERLAFGKTDPAGSNHRWSRGIIYRHDDGDLYAAVTRLSPNQTDEYYDLATDPFQFGSGATSSAGSLAARAFMDSLVQYKTGFGQGTGTRRRPFGAIGGASLRSGGIG